MDKNAKIYVAGHHGLVGSAIWKNLQEKGYTNLVGRTHKELDLLDGAAVKQFFDEEMPEYVFLAAAFVGGIMANSIYRADFIYKNLQIQQNVIGESFRHQVKKLLFLGSTCIYPRDAEQPMKEDVLLTSPLEYTNEPYAIAKIAGLKMCESFNLQYGTNYIAVMPTNLYGPNDNFDLERSHVLPAMIRKVHLAHCLKKGDWEAVRKDMNLRPVEGISGANSNEEILRILRKYALLDDLFNNQRNSHDQIGFHVGKRLEDNLRARHAGKKVNLATYRKFIQELESQSVHVCHRQHGYDLITCFQWKYLESESCIRP